MKRLLLMAVLLLSAGAFADVYAGAGLGVTFAEGQRGSNPMDVYYARGGASLFNWNGRVSAGLHFLRYRDTFRVSSAAAVDTLTTVGSVELLLRRFLGTGLYFGVRGGVAALSGTAQQTDFAWAPALGAEIEIIPALSLTADVSYLCISRQNISAPTLTGGVLFHW
jgi:opacity protein-like surface antigen